VLADLAVAFEAEPFVVVSAPLKRKPAGTESAASG
jgi:hypothetical protein